MESRSGGVASEVGHHACCDGATEALERRDELDAEE